MKDTLRALKDSSREMRTCTLELLVRGIPRTPYADEQTASIADVLRELAFQAHDGFTRDLLHDAAEDLGDRVEQLKLDRQAEEEDYDETMRRAYAGIR